MNMQVLHLCLLGVLFTTLKTSNGQLVNGDVIAIPSENLISEHLHSKTKLLRLRRGAPVFGKGQYGPPNGNYGPKSGPRDEDYDSDGFLIGGRPNFQGPHAAPPYGGFNKGGFDKGGFNKWGYDVPTDVESGGGGGGGGGGNGGGGGGGGGLRGGGGGGGGGRK